MNPRDKIKVFHLTWSMYRGGLETFIMNVFRNINRDKFDFTFLCEEEIVGDYEDEIISLEGSIKHLPTIMKGGFLKRNLTRIKERIKFFRVQGDFILHIHTNSAAHAYLITYAARKSGVNKIIVHSHNTKSKDKIEHRFFKPLLKRSKIIRLACGKEAGRWLFGKKKYRVINNGIDTRQFAFSAEKRALMREKLNLGDCFTIIHVGRFVAAKNHGFLLDIFNQVLQSEPKSKLLLVGNGELQDETSEKARILGISDAVCFLGTRTDINDIMQAADVFCLPSLFEGLPVVLVEAQCSGLQCVVSDKVTYDANISGKVYFIPLEVPPGLWAQKLIATKNAGRYDALDVIAKKGYDIKSTVDELSGIYEELWKS